MWLCAVEKCDICQATWIMVMGEGDGPDYPIDEDDAFGVECPKCHNMSGYPMKDDIEIADEWDVDGEVDL